MAPLNNGSRHPLYRHLAISLGIIVALITAKTIFEEISWVKWLEEKTYDVIQKHHVAGGTTESPDVLVIDIGEIKPEPVERDGRIDMVTPRAPIKDLIQIFADLGARSIGVDVDFSPENGQFVHPKDREFFDEYLELSDRTTVPVFLGVYRTFRQPYKWLGDDRYIRLAALIAIREVVEHDQIPHWIRTKNGFLLRSMSAALAGVDVNTRGEQDFSQRWLVHSTSIVKSEPNLESEESTIDYSYLKRITQDVLPVLDAVSYGKMKAKIKGRMILLGDTNPAKGDRFPTRVGEIPGVFVLAAGANTIATLPLNRLRPLGRIGMDLMLALIIFCLVEFSSGFSRWLKGSHTHASYGLNIVLTFVAIILVTVVSVFLVRWTRLLWTDFVLVCVVLLIQLGIDIVMNRNERKAG